MRLLLLVAMDKEMALIKNLMKDAKDVEFDGLKLIEGTISGHEVFLGKCGIGKVNAAVNTYRLITAVNPDMVVDSGVAGGAGLPIGSVLVADRISYSDVWCGPGTEYGEADGFPLFFRPSRQVLDIASALKDIPGLYEGLICSSDKFISKAEEIAFIRSHFPDVKAVDMESASVAQVCMMTSKPFAIIRVVSDTPGEGENVAQYENFWSVAPELTFQTISKIIDRL